MHQQLKIDLVVYLPVINQRNSHSELYVVYTHGHNAVAFSVQLFANPIKLKY